VVLLEEHFKYVGKQLERVQVKQLELWVKKGTLENDAPG
jgi:hypothetical protein